MKPKRKPDRGRYVVGASKLTVWGLDHALEDSVFLNTVGRREAEVLAELMGETSRIFKLVPVRRIPAAKARRRPAKKGK